MYTIPQYSKEGSSGLLQGVAFAQKNMTLRSADPPLLEPQGTLYGDSFLPRQAHQKCSQGNPPLLGLLLDCADTASCQSKHISSQPGRPSTSEVQLG